MSSARQSAYKARGDSAASLKLRLKEQCIARVREQRAVIIERARRESRDRQRGDVSAQQQHDEPHTDGGTASQPQDVAASFNAIINAELVHAKQRMHGGALPASPSPSSPEFALSQQSNSSANCSTPPSQLSPHLLQSPPLSSSQHAAPVSAALIHSPMTSFASSSPPSFVPLSHGVPPFPRQLVASLPSAAYDGSMDEADEKKEEATGDSGDLADLLSYEEYVALMNDMEEELRNEFVQDRTTDSGMEQDDGQCTHSHRAALECTSMES